LPWQLSLVVSPQPAEGQSPDDWLDGLSDALLEAGALSVTIEDADAQEARRERPLFGEPGSPQSLRAWPSSRLHLLLTEDEEPLAWWQAPHQPWARLGLDTPDVVRLGDEDWVTKTQAQFTPLEIGDTLWVGPSWHEAPAVYRQPPRLALTIDPGMAFGTGGHATTQLCLEAILAAFASGAVGPDSRVLDYGCGSGILALAAAGLGAEEVIALDIDPIAVRVAQANAQANRLDHRVRCISAQEDLSRQRSVPATGFDLVVANILAQPLKVLAPVLWQSVGPQGGLVLSGLLESQAEALTDWFAAADPRRPRLRLLGRREGWACLGYLPDSQGT
jgi:ribosomal protein L11 methyltransferase